MFEGGKIIQLGGENKHENLFFIANQTGKIQSAKSIQ